MRAGRADLSRQHVCHRMGVFPGMSLCFIWLTAECALFLADKIFDDEDSVDGNRPSSASSSTSSKAPANSRRVGMGTTRRLGSAALGSKSSSKLITYMNWFLCKVFMCLSVLCKNLQTGPQDPVTNFPLWNHCVYVVCMPQTNLSRMNLQAVPTSLWCVLHLWKVGPVQLCTEGYE